MAKKKNTHAVTSDQTSTASAFSEGASKEMNQTKNTTGTRLLHCCLPTGEGYTDQPMNLRAAELEARARAWIAVNETVWSQWVASVKADAANQRRWSVQALAENARVYDRVNDSGEPFKVNNDLRPALARILCEEVPSACDWVEVRTSVFERARDERLDG